MIIGIENINKKRENPKTRDGMMPNLLDLEIRRTVVYTTD